MGIFFTGGNGLSIFPQTNADLLTNLISFWELEESSGTRVDAHGSNDLTDNNTVTSNTGKINTAADFTSGNSEYLSIASNSELQTGDIDFTMCLWVYLDVLGAQRPLMGKWNNASPNVEYLIFFDPSTDFAFIVRDTGDTTNTLQSATTFGTPSTATWYFIVAWHDAIANTLNIQINNGTVDSSAYSNGVKSGGQAFELGRNGSLYHDGRIDQAGLWKRVLTATERTWLYNGGNGRLYSDLGV